MTMNSDPSWWNKPLAALDRGQWEALCDGCGRCCLHKLEDEDTGEVVETNVACQLLDPRTARCSDYRNRRRKVPDCLRLTLQIVEDVSWLPPTCAYRLRADEQPLPRWHPLVGGDPAGPVKAGMSVIGRTVSELDAGPLEHHIVEWSSHAAEDA